MALVTTGEAATGSTAAEGADMLSSLATLSMRPALSRPTELPGGQPPGSADGRFVRQANLHLSDAEGLSQLVATARDVPLSEWEDPTTLKPALEAAHTRLCSMVRATSQTINALEAAMAPLVGRWHFGAARMWALAREATWAWPVDARAVVGRRQVLPRAQLLARWAARVWRARARMRAAGGGNVRRVEWAAGPVEIKAARLATEAVVPQLLRGV